MSLTTLSLKSNQISDMDVEKSKSSLSDTNSDSKLVMEKKLGPDSEKSSVLSVIVRMTVASICGIFFGIALEKGRVFEPKSIRDQMVFKNFIMLKMFLAATAAGQVCFALLSIIPQTKVRFERASEEYVACFSQKTILTSVLGAFSLGAGMTLAGACPGMVLAQIGAWVPNSVFTLLGAFLGTLTYGLLSTYIIKVTKPKNPFTHHLVHKKLEVKYIYIALPMIIILTVVIALLEYFWHWKKDLNSLGNRYSGGSNFVTTVSWPPYASGILIGVLQLPIVLVLQDSIGGSGGYITLMSQWVVTKSLKEKFPYMASKRLGVLNWWQVFYVTACVIGALISATSSDSLSVALGTPVHYGFAGGFLMLFGARFAAGCTSGHGLSGMGLLAWFSFLAVPSMFAGGIATAFAMRATGALDTYVTQTGQV